MKELFIVRARLLYFVILFLAGFFLVGCESPGEFTLLSGTQKDDYSAEIVKFDFPEVMRAGELYVVSITIKNSGNLPWNMYDKYRLGVISKDNFFGNSRIDVPDVVYKGDLVELRFPIVAPLEEGLYVEKYQMLQEMVLWFGDILEVKIPVKANDNDKIKLDEFELILSKSDAEHFDQFTKESLQVGFKREDLNEWRKAELIYNGDEYKIKLKIHGDTDTHYKGDYKSYRVKLTDGDLINGFSEFSLIIFSDRSYHPIANSFYSDLLSLYGISYELSLVSVNDAGYIPYYFRGRGIDEYVANNELSNSSLVTSPFISEVFLNRAIRKEGGSHQTFLNDEFSFNEIEGDSVNKSKIAYSLFLLSEALEKGGYKEILKFFDYDYLIDVTALSTILQTNHDMAGDNLDLVYRETEGKFYPIVSSEVVYGYIFGLIEAESNRELCSVNVNGKRRIKYGDLIDIFSQLNRNFEFRQEKYKKVFEIISDDSFVDELIKKVSSYYEATLDYSLDINDFQHRDYVIYALEILIHNIDFLKSELSFSKLIIFLSQNGEGSVVELNPLSVSELKFSEFVVNFNEPFNPGDSMTVFVDSYSGTKSFDVYFEEVTSQLDLVSYLENEKIALGLDEAFLPIKNITKITLIDRDNSVVSLNAEALNQVTGAVVEKEDLLIFIHADEYLASFEKYFKYGNVGDDIYCKTKYYNDLTNFDKSIVDDSGQLWSRYSELWNFVKGDSLSVEGIQASFSDILLTLQNYTPSLDLDPLLNVINYDLSLSKLFVNVVQKNNVVLFEFMPISLSGLKLDYFGLHFDKPFAGPQEVDYVVKGAKGEYLYSGQFSCESCGDTVDASEILNDLRLSSHFDSNLKLVKAKFTVELTFVDSGVVGVNLIDLKGINTVTNQEIDQSDIVYFVADGNKYYLEEKEFGPIETAWRYGVFSVEEDTLFMSGNIDIKEDVVVPEGTKLIIEPGTNITMAPGVSIVSYSQIVAKGTKDSQINVRAADPDNPFGVFALIGEGASGSSFDFFNIQGGKDAYINGIYFSGMFDGYHCSDVIVNQSSFENASADDALNFKYSNSVVKNSYFIGNSFDAIDFDFMAGKIESNRFEGNGNDAIDLSGSTTVIKNNYVYKSGDKCISLGEESSSLVVNNLLDSCAIGIEVKDLSTPVILNNTIIGNDIGMNVYQKKEVFGGAFPEVWNTLFLNNTEDITFKNTFEGSLLKTDNSEAVIKYSSLSGEYLKKGKGNLDSADISVDQLWIDEEGDFKVINEYLPDYVGEVKIGLLDITLLKYD